MSFLFPGCVTRYTTFVTRWQEKSFVSYATFMARQPLDDLLWFWVANRCGLTGHDGLQQLGWEAGFLVFLLADIAFVVLLRGAVAWRYEFNPRKTKRALILTLLCAVTSALFFAFFISHVDHLFRTHKDDSAVAAHQWHFIALLALLKIMRICVLLTFVFWLLFSAVQTETTSYHTDFKRHNSLSCLESRGLLPKLRSLAFIALGLAVYALYSGPIEVVSALISQGMFFIIIAAIALLYYALQLDSCVGPCVWSMCESLTVFNQFGPCMICGWGPWCVFESKKVFAFGSDVCCQGATVDLVLHRQDDATTDVVLPESFVSKSGNWANSSWGMSLRRSLRDTIQKDLQTGDFAVDISNDNPRTPLFLLSGQPSGFNLQTEDEVWTSHASNPFWATALGYVDELKCCSQKLPLTKAGNVEDHVVGYVYLLKVTNPEFYAAENGGGVYHYDGAECPLCLWCPCCQLNRGKLLARHNYCCTEYCGDDAPTGMADAYIFKWGAQQKAGLKVARTYRIVTPTARPVPKTGLLAQPVQDAMEPV